MGKSKRSDKEFTREQKLINENRILKRNIASLRKELARVDLDRYKNLKETIDQHYQEDSAEFASGQDMLEKIKADWKCREPGCEGFLEIFLYNKINATYYYRKCNCCNNRTKSQRYTTDVKGIVKNPQ